MTPKNGKNNSTSIASSISTHSRAVPTRTNVAPMAAATPRLNFMLYAFLNKYGPSAMSSVVAVSMITGFGASEFRSCAAMLA